MNVNPPIVNEELLLRVAIDVPPFTFNVAVLPLTEYVPCDVVVAIREPDTTHVKFRFEWNVIVVVTSEFVCLQVPINVTVNGFFIPIPLFKKFPSSSQEINAVPNTRIVISNPVKSILFNIFVSPKLKSQ